jgi:Uma2 family endonuclease
MNQQFRSGELSRTTQAAEGLMRRAWSVAEIEAMVQAGIIQEDDRFELIGGDVVPMSPKGNKHEIYKASLLEFWIQHKTEKYRIIPETTFRLDPYSFVEPDFVFYDAAVKVPQLAPENTFLAVEISDTTLGYDLGRKPRIYSNANVKALWVIDVNNLETHVFGQPGIDGYRSIKIIAANEILAPDFAPELAVKMSELVLI